LSAILITGANGLIGSRLLARLAGKREVIAVGRGPQRANSTAAGVRYIDLELGQPGRLRALIEEARPASVIHAAAMTDVDACERDELAAWRLNVGAVEEAALGARATGARLVSISTDYVFDGDSGPYSEADVPNPRGVYARSKRCGEEAALLLAPGSAVARVAVVYSGFPGARRTFAQSTLEALLAGREVRAFADQSVSPTLADNAAEMILGLEGSGERGLWHCTGASVVTRVEFCRALARKLGADERLIVQTRLADAKLLAPRPLKAGLRVERIQALLGESAPLPLEAQLDRFLKERAL
jgi:dTDP-4-dehydrorhamnose reductase